MCGETKDVRVQKLKYFAHSYGVNSENINLWKKKRIEVTIFSNHFYRLTHT